MLRFFSKNTMNRREFSGFVAGAAVSALLPSSLFAELTTGVSPMAAELYARALVLDCNSGPPYEDGVFPWRKPILSWSTTQA